MEAKSYSGFSKDSKLGRSSFESIKKNKAIPTKNKMERIHNNFTILEGKSDFQNPALSEFFFNLIAKNFGIDF